MINERCAKKYCSEPIELIENYDAAVADQTQTWCCHHRLEVQGQFTNSFELLKRCGMYENRPAKELIFLSPREHRLLHRKTYSDNAKKYINTLSYEQKRARALFMHSKTTFEQRSKAGKKGGKNAMAKRTFEQRSKAFRSMKWWNNGVISKRAKESPGPEWNPGMIRSH